MTDKNFVSELRAKMFARSGVLIVRDEDEGRILAKVRSAAIADGCNVWVWSTAKSLVQIADAEGAATPDAEPVMGGPRGDQALSPAELMGALEAWTDGPSIVVAYDFASLMNRLPTAVPLARQLRDMGERQQSQNEGSGVVQMLIVDFEEPQVPSGLQRLTLELPDRDECSALLDDICAAVSVEVADEARANRERILNALSGLPAFQISNALAESIARTGKIDVSAVRDYKRAMVADKGLTWVDTDPRGFDSIGGMAPFKAWSQKRAAAFGPLAAEYGIEPPRGCIVAGVPGTGKSAMVKALAEAWGFTLLRFDVGGTRGKYQGESEASFEAALKTAEAVAPCILHIDEAEKAFAGVTGSGDTDGGTGSRTFSTFLTWLQERTASVFVYMTANRPDTLPSEFTRAGRLDGSWWVDAPTATERASIVDVFTAKYPKAASVDASAVVEASERNTGAEIEAAFRESLIVALSETRDVETADVVEQLSRLSRVVDTFNLGDDLQAWKDSAMRANDAAEPVKASASAPRGRALGLGARK